MAFKPLLSATIEDTSKLQYPVFASVKLDGIRCLVIDGVAVSRNLKPIRNKHVQACIGKPEYNGLDGELIVGNVFAKDCYRVTNSGVMSEDGEPDFTFFVFDRFDMGDGYMNRLNTLKTMPYVSVVGQVEISSEEQLLKYEQYLLDQGAEGVMVRSYDGIYKQGRSTLKDRILGKLKRFSDAEYEVVGFIERMHNANEATVNALGHTERSAHKENMVGRGDLGALVCKYDGGTFNCGTGFTDQMRAEIWADAKGVEIPWTYREWDASDQEWKTREGIAKPSGIPLIGRKAKIKSFLIGVKDAPRFPVFLGWREDL